MTRAERIDRYRGDHETYERHQGVVVDSAYVALRLDGRAFHTFTKEFEKPFDTRIEAAMGAACEKLMEIPGAIYVYTQSDEITLIFDAGFDWFSRRVEKLVSVSAAIASTAFSATIGEIATFDSRVLSLDSAEDIMAVLAERQMDARKNFYSLCAYWMLRNEGKTCRQADRELQPLSTFEREMLVNESIYADEPSFRIFGRAAEYILVPHEGFNPRIQQAVKTTRRRLRWNVELASYAEVDVLPVLIPETDVVPL